MIDLHTHILHGVDDGAKTLDDAVAMVKRAHQIGINTIVLTPHISLFRGFKATKEYIMDQFEQLKTSILKSGLDTRLILGAEIDEHDHIMHTLKKGYTIEGTSYTLIDFSMREADISEILYDLRHSGYKVIVAHPERIDYLSYADLIKLKAEGALFQVSSSHLLPFKLDGTSRIAKRLLKDNMIDLVASDSHRLETIDTMKKSFQYVTRKKGVDIANNLFINHPMRIIGLEEEK